MPPYNDLLDGNSNHPPSHIHAPTSGSALSDSINIRHKLAGGPPGQSKGPLTSPTPRPAADMTFSSSSSSPDAWGAFPHSHPEGKKNEPSSSESVSNSVHPHIRELVERQQQKIKQQQQKMSSPQSSKHSQYDQHQDYMRAHRDHVRLEKLMKQHTQTLTKEMNYHQSNDDGVIKGLHMDHVLNDQYQEGKFNESAKTSYPNPAAYNANDYLSSPYNHVGGMGSPLTNQVMPPLSPPLSPRFDQQAPLSPAEPHLPTNTVDDSGDYVIEGTIQNKGCISQTADDVGFLFGCGTHPQDEVVYVYNNKPEPKKESPAARADERNLFYHLGPSNDIPVEIDPRLHGPRNGVSSENVNDVLFQIDREYQAMKAAHEGNMGNHLHGEFLRDPPPPQQPVISAVPPRGHYHVVHDDDIYADKGSCSISTPISGLLDFFRPESRRKKPRSKSCSPRLARMGDADERAYSANFLCATPRRLRMPNPASSSSSADGDDLGSTTSSFDKAKQSVKELQSQLKAMVQDRAWRQHQKENGYPVSPKEDETRQEPTPPSTPPRNKDFSAEDKEIKKIKEEEATNKVDSSSKELELLRQEQQNLNAARKLLQTELAQMQMYNNPNTMGVNPMATPLSPTAMAFPPNSMGVQPMVLSPLTAATSPPMMFSNPGAVPGMPLGNNGMHNGIMANGISNNGMFMNNGMSNGVNNGMNFGMGNNNMTNGNNSMNNAMMGNSGMVGNGLNNGIEQQQQQQQQTRVQAGTLRKDADTEAILQDANSMQSTTHTRGYGNPANISSDAKSVMSNIGTYPIRPRASPRTSPKNTLRSPPSRDPPQANDEFSQSNNMLNDLKIKNALIRQDITRMKSCVGDNNKSNSPSNYRGGINVAGGIRRVGAASKISPRRPFPRTSPPSSPNKQKRYEFQDNEQTIARAMQRSDDARSLRGSCGSVSTGSSHHHRGSPSNGNHYQMQQQRQGGILKRQPPSPWRINK